MKYAVISDIHGNNHAFRAVLADAETMEVDTYLLLGDYASSFPQGGEVVNAIRKLKSAVVVRGNGEDYFVPLKGKAPHELTHEQMKPVYWGYRSLSPESLEYVLSLPKAAAFMDCGIEINLTHQMELFYRKPKIKPFWSEHFREIMNEKPFTHDEYVQFAREALLSTPGTIDEILRLPKGVYLLGHNHLQFHMEYEGRLFINPGSCGEPLDWDTRAAYTVLTIGDGSWNVEERRVPYNTQLIIDALDSSGFTEYAPVWSSIMKKEALEAKDSFAPFVWHVLETGRKMGEYESPVSNTVWEAAVRTWDMDKK